MESVTEKFFVPALPTLWPEMLGAAPKSTWLPPFSSARSHQMYFARNAVWITVKMLGLDQGEVLVPAYHHGVELEALADAGAKLRFYRVGAHWDVDVEDVRRKITSRTKALYLTHYAGFPGPTDQMRALADERGLPLIEDCALSLLSSDGARPLGTTGDVGIFCLYKTLPVPNGGAMVINSDRGYTLPKPLEPGWASTFSHAVSSLLQNLELRGGSVGRSARAMIRKLGKGTAQAAKVERVATGTQHFNRAHVELGMSPLTRRIAGSQDLNGIIERRRRNYFFLMGRLRDVAPTLFNELPPGVCPLFFPLLVSDKQPILEGLAERGIEAIDFWRHSHPGCELSEFPEVAELRRTVLEIPCHQDLTPEAMAYVAKSVRKVVEQQNSRVVVQSLGT